MLWTGDKALILASQSQSRKALLAAAGLDVETLPANLDERGLQDESGLTDPSEVATLLAQAKAENVAARFRDRIVIGADQTLSLNGHIFGKPEDRADAANHLRQFSGQTHELHSAVAVMRNDEILFDHVSIARMTMRKLSDETIESYLDVAGARVTTSVGAYQLEGLGIHLFKQIDGDHSTILGLPLLPLLRFFRSHNWLTFDRDRLLMKLIGLTGSIGMGKSTTMQMFAEQGVPVYDADAAVHAIYSGEAVPHVEAAFPGTTASGKVDRQKLSAHVLGKSEALKKLETIVHPLLGSHRAAFLKQAEESGAKFAVLDVPLLFETGGEKRMDAVVVVSAPADVQRARVLARENMTPEKLDAILARQMPDAEKRKRADFVVDTSSGLEPVRAHIRDILEQVGKMPAKER